VFVDDIQDCRQADDKNILWEEGIKALLTMWFIW
jgi:hypothetical protein